MRRDEKLVRLIRSWSASETGIALGPTEIVCPLRMLPLGGEDMLWICLHGVRTSSKSLEKSGWVKTRIAKRYACVTWACSSRFISNTLAFLG